MNRLSVLGKKLDQNLQIEIEFKLQFKNYNCICYPCPSDAIKHFLKTFQPTSLELLFSVLIIQLK